MLNSLYGAIGNAHFRWHKFSQATAITITGQAAIKWTQRRLNEYTNKLLKTDNVDYVTYIDTDSVVGESVINVNGNDITIADFFDSVEGEFVRNRPDDLVKHVIGKHITPSMNVDTTALEHNAIKYVMKHTVKKRMYKFTTPSGNSVTVTEDHSIIAKKKDGTVVSCSAKEIISDISEFECIFEI